MGGDEGPLARVAPHRHDDHRTDFARRAYAYRPLVSEADCAAAASESFLERVFGGSLTPMVAQFVERRRLSPEEIAELRRLLDRAV